ncbi:MAG: coenzyme biosynthesis protein [Thermoleophilia bacterium]|nr:coenzyme biosynthesis protein [Thermoleophilia bacterium]
MRIRILGSAAGGGSPQWNCNCATCAAVRAGEPGTEHRTQSSIALRGAEGGWVLVNASPDLRQQVERMGDVERSSLRSSPFVGVVLTDAEIDHAAGLLLLRESGEPLRVHSTDEVRATLTDDYPLLRMLDDWCGIAWTALEPGVELQLPGTSLVVEPFVTGEDPPRFRRAAPVGPGASIGLVVRDAADPTAGRLTYCPSLEAWTAEIEERFRASRLVLVDGTFWSNDELVGAGIGTRDARAMGHLPMDGPDGTRERLASLDAQVVYVHLNNSNPVLLAHAPERALLDAADLAVGFDGMELELA